MIEIDQPRCFPSSLKVSVSSRSDGTMLNRLAGTHTDEAVLNRRVFCKQDDVDYSDVVYQRIEYLDTATYDSIRLVDELSTTRYQQEVAADAIITQTAGVGIFLPLADCIGLVLYSPKKHLVAVLHMGRHSTLTNLIPRSLDAMVNLGVNTQEIIAWMSPSVSQNSYKMEQFQASETAEWLPYCETRNDGIYLDLAGFNRQRLRDSGVLASNIHVSPVDTVTSEDYYSHSAGDQSGRFAVLAALR